VHYTFPAGSRNTYPTKIDSSAEKNVKLMLRGDFSTITD